MHVAGGAVRRTQSVPACGTAGTSSFVGGNAGNVPGGVYSGVLSGFENQACDAVSQIAGGYENAISSSGNTAGESFIGAGKYNEITGSGDQAFLGAGYLNSVTGADSVLGGGSSNQNAGTNAMLGAGQGNGITAAGTDAVLGGGSTNTISSEYGFIGGGHLNTLTGLTAAMSGGFNNTNAGTNSMLDAGESNSVTSAAGDAFIGAGSTNTVSAQYGVIVGGEHNNVSGEGAYIAAGGYNTASGEGAVVDGGFNSTAGGAFATIPGGYVNNAAGTYSFAAGARASAAETGTFVWSDGSDGDAILTSARAYEFLARASGGFTLWTNAASTVGATLAPGSGTWASASDRNLKTDVVRIDDAAVLDKVAHLPIDRWSYKSERGVRHVGPMAQDFYAAFGVGSDDKHITSLDEDGVALAAIKALHAENARLRARQEKMQVQLDRLVATVSALRSRP